MTPKERAADLSSAIHRAIREEALRGQYSCVTWDMVRGAIDETCFAGASFIMSEVWGIDDGLKDRKHEDHGPRYSLFYRLGAELRAIALGNAGRGEP